MNNSTRDTNDFTVTLDSAAAGSIVNIDSSVWNSTRDSEDDMLSTENGATTDTDIVNINSSTEDSFSSKFDITDIVSDINYNNNSRKEGRADINTPNDTEGLYDIDFEYSGELQSKKLWWLFNDWLSYRAGWRCREFP